MYRLVYMYSQSIDEFVQSIYKWTEFTPQLEQQLRVGDQENARDLYYVGPLTINKF